MVSDRGTWRGKLSCARFAEENAAGEKAAADAMNGSIDIHMIIFLSQKRQLFHNGRNGPQTSTSHKIVQGQAQAQVEAQKFQNGIWISYRGNR